MKPIEQLNNVEKAKLLHQLFPQEIPALLTFINSMCQTIKEDEERNRSTWDNGFMSFDFWLKQINEVEKSIAQYGKKLADSPTAFSHELFDGMLAIFTAHCLHVYTTIKVHPNAKFTVAVELLFNP